MATTKPVVKEFKGGFAVVDPNGDPDLFNDNVDGEVITRTQTKQQADDYVKGLRGTDKET